MRRNVTIHGYGGYTNGCRCDVCRQAKADYMRDRRATAYLEPQQPVPDITHGRFGYEERGCRCDVCVGARREGWRRDNRQRRTHMRGEAA